MLCNSLVEEFFYFRHSFVFAATQIKISLDEISDALTSAKVKQSEVKDVAKEIEELLAKRTMTFTQLLNELKISSATLTKYLNELDKTLLYSLKNAT